MTEAEQASQNMLENERIHKEMVAENNRQRARYDALDTAVKIKKVQINNSSEEDTQELLLSAQKIYNWLLAKEKIPNEGD